MSTAARQQLELGRVGESVARVDGIPKTTGEFAYSSDLVDADMLWGHTVRSPHAHARITRIDISDALSMPAVHAVLTHEDVPGEKHYGLEFADQPVLAIDRVRYFGEPVALVAAEHPEQARRAAERIVVEYEPLELVVDPERASEQPPLHPEPPTHGHRYLDDPRPNVIRSMIVRHGDPDAEGEVKVEGVYEVGIQDQAFLGPESGWPCRTERAASTSTSRLSGSTSTATRWRPASGSSRSRCGSISPAWAAPSAGGRTCPCRSTAPCSRCTRGVP